MGFLGVGKTTAIVNLLKQKPENESWAVLVNEFGKVGVDGAIFSAAGVTVSEVAGGCLCCAVSVPFQVSINRLLKDVKPDRLIIEPSGLGHPRKVIDMLVNNAFKGVLDLRANICLVDPQKFKDKRYTGNINFVDQIALSDVLVANKMDLADHQAVQLFYQWTEKQQPRKSLIAQTSEGQLDFSWLDIPRNIQRQALYPTAHQITEFHSYDAEQNKIIDQLNSYQSFGCIFPADHCFEYKKLNTLFNRLNIERIKGIIYTDKGWFIINGTQETFKLTKTASAINSLIEFISYKY